MRRLNKPLRLVLVLLAIGAVVALIALRPGSSQSDVDQVKEVVNKIFTSNDPAICFDLVTPRFLAATYGEDPDQATSKCQASQTQGGGTAQSVELQTLTIDGARAVVTVVVHGGTLAGRTAQATLVDSDGWRIDALRLSEPLPTSKETRSIIDAAIRTALIEKQGLSRKKAACMVEYLRQHASDAQLAEDLKTFQKGEVPRDFAEAATTCKVAPR
jgi:hypothetical protein